MGEGNTRISGNSSGGNGLIGVRGLMKINATTIQKAMMASNASIVSIFRTVFFINNSFLPCESGMDQSFLRLIIVYMKIENCYRRNVSQVFLGESNEKNSPESP